MTGSHQQKPGKTQSSLVMFFLPFFLSKWAPKSWACWSGKSPGSESQKPSYYSVSVGLSRAGGICKTDRLPSSFCQLVFPQHRTICGVAPDASEEGQSRAVEVTSVNSPSSTHSHNNSMYLQRGFCSAAPVLHSGSEWGFSNRIQGVQGCYFGAVPLLETWDSEEWLISLTRNILQLLQFMQIIFSLLSSSCDESTNILLAVETTEKMFLGV